MQILKAEERSLPGLLVSPAPTDVDTDPAD
jgi:hypothetical protein